MLDVSTQWLAVLVDASVKAAVLALVSAAGLALLRVRDSNVRHRVWTGVLCGMLLLPGLTQVVPVLRLPCAVDPAWFARFNAPELGDEPKNSPLALSDWQLSPVAQSESPQPAPVESATDKGADDSDEFAVVDATNRNVRETVGRGTAREHPAVLALVVFSAWIGGGLLLTLRLLVGLWTTRLLKRASVPVSARELPNGSDTRLGTPRGPIPIFECPRIGVPLTLGAFRPRILLPIEWRDWPVEKLRVVLVHEQTHAERGDCALALLAEANRCLYWFHPLAWWLRRRLANLAEAACDDAAIGSLGDRAGYARHLLEVAAAARAHRGRLVLGGVSMARRSNVESRINAILDSTRPLSRQLTRGTALLLIGLIVPLVALAAAVRPSIGAFPAAVVVEAGDQPEADSLGAGHDPKAAAPKSGNVDLAANDIQFAFTGTVVGPDRQPVAGARVALSYLRLDPEAPDIVPAVLTDSHGKFELSSKKSNFSDSGGYRGASWFEAGLVATKEGLGFAYGWAAHFDTTGRFEKEVPERRRSIMEWKAGKKTGVLTMRADDVPIHGRLVNTERMPIAGARLEVIGVYEGEGGSLDHWEAAAAQKDVRLDSTWQQLIRLVDGYWGGFAGFREHVGRREMTRWVDDNNLVPGSRPLIVPQVRTDADGRFLITGIGRDRMADIQFRAPGMETTFQFARTRHTEAGVTGVPGRVVV